MLAATSATSATTATTVAAHASEIGPKGVGLGSPATYTKIQTESREDVLFVRNELQTAVLAAVQERTSTLEAISDARTRILVAKKLQPSTSDKQPPRADMQGVQLEVERRLAKWIDLMFEYVAPNVQVNGIEFDKAFEDVQEYEPCDEGLRKEADDLQNNVQNTLVRTTQMRREAPQQLDVMISESIQILTDITEKAMIIEPEIPARQPVPEFGIPAPEFSETMRDYTDVAAAHGIVSKFVIPKLHKAKRAQETLDSLKVPPASEITISIPRKSQTPRANRRQSSVAKYAVTPRTARFGLLRRLEAEVQQSPHEDGESYNKSLIENHQDVGNEMHY